MEISYIPMADLMSCQLVIIVRFVSQPLHDTRATIFSNKKARNSKLLNMISSQTQMAKGKHQALESS